MRDKNPTTITSYGYLTKTEMETAAEIKNETDTATNAIMNYTTFEFLKNTKDSRRNSRRRVEKSRQCRQYSDVESDTGSDGVAVNSSGSGRSGDWAPSKRRVKPKCRKKSDPCLTDSGISLSKDTESLSELALQSCQDGSIYQQTESQAERFYDTTSSTPAKNVVTQKRHIALRRSSSLSALPSNIKPLDKHNPRLSSRRGSSFSTRRGSQMISVEDKVNAILQQCYENEGILPVTEYSNDQGRSYVFDCSQPLGQSKFPLPDHLNYPLCKYRYKSESILNKSPVKSFQKLKKGLKKLKSKKADKSGCEPTSELTFEQSSTLSSTNYLDYFSESDEDEDNEAILERLGSNPSQNKSFIKKLFGKVTGKSYSANDGSTIKDLGSTIRQPSNRVFQRSGSIRSIPDALKDMWGKFHQHETEDCSPQFHVNEMYNEPAPMMSVLSRAISMPSIACHNMQAPEHAIYIHENISPKEQNQEENYFSNFYKPMSTSPDKPKLGGTDVITGVLGQSSELKEINKYKEAKQTLLDATLTMVTDTLTRKDQNESLKDIAEETTTTTNVENSENLNKSAFKPYNNNNDKVRKISQHSMYATPEELDHSNHVQHFYNPQTYYGPQAVPMAANYCPCCMHNTPPPPQAQYHYGGYYAQPHPQRHYMYDNMGQPGQSQTLDERRMVPRENIIAPLDVQMSIERKAERRKISDMIFDTFV